jgi:hypothetical protein
MMEIILSSLIITGIFASVQEGMIFFPLKQFLNRYLSNRYGKFIAKPLYDCLTCMSSIHGTWLYFAVNCELNYLIYIFALVGINYLISKYLDTTTGIDSSDSKRL